MSESMVSVAVGVASFALTVITLAWQRSRSSGMDQFKLNHLDEDSKAHARVISELQIVQSAQHNINTTQREWNSRKEERVENLQRDVNQMRGREDGRDHRNRPNP